MNNMSRFTAGAQEAVNQAAQFASSMGENYVGTEHLLLGMILEGGTAAEILSKQGINADNAREYIVSVSTDGGYGNPQVIGYTPRTKKIIEMSVAFSRQLGQNFIGTEHMLLAIINERESMGYRMLHDLNADMAAMQQEILAVAQGAPVSSDENSKSTTPKLDKFGRDLTLAAKTINKGK